MGLRAEIDREKQFRFTDPEAATDEDALGIVVARFVKWDGAAILRVAQAALKDANFHGEAELLRALEGLL